MKKYDIKQASPALQKLYQEVMEAFPKQKVFIYLSADLPRQIMAHNKIDKEGDLILIVNEKFNEEYVISHELLHSLVKNQVPIMIKPIDFSLVGMIGTKLQEHLEHKWILNEQRRRGIEFDEQQIYEPIEKFFKVDEKEIIKNMENIFLISEIYRSFPELVKKYLDFWQKQNVSSLAYAQRIMAYYPEREILSNDESRRVTVKALREWEKIFEENNFNSDSLRFQLPVTSVFSKTQLERSARLSLGFIPNALVGEQSSQPKHLLFAENDKQCNLIFSAGEKAVADMQESLDLLTLNQFLQKYKIPYLMRIG